MTNVDQNELNKFNDLAAKWWDKEGEFKPLHDINPLRMGFIEECCEIKGKRVLDVGCGGGILTESLASQATSTTGIDAAESVLNVAKLHRHESNLDIDYQLTLIEEFKPEDAFDVITCLEMLEHVPNPSSTIKEIARLIKPGGNVFFSTINRNPKAYLFAIVGAEYLLRMLPKGTHDYEKFIKPSELDAWLREYGFELKSIKGMHYNPLTKHYKLNSDPSVNYIVHAVKL